MNKKKLRERLELKVRPVIETETHYSVKTTQHYQFSRGVKIGAQAQLNKVLNGPDLAWIDRDIKKQLDISDMLPEELRRSWPHRYGAKYAIEYMHSVNYLPVIPLSEMKEGEG